MRILSGPLVLFVVLMVSISCEAPQFPTEAKPLGLDSNVTPHLNMSPYDILTDEQEAQLKSLARIDDWGIDPWANGISGGTSIAEFWIWTQATIPFGVFFPRIRHDALVTVTTPSGTSSHMHVDPDYTTHLDGLKWRSITVSQLNCQVEASGTLMVEAVHRAKWQYYKIPGLLNFDKTANTPPTSDNCYGNGGCHDTCIICDPYDPYDPGDPNLSGGDCDGGGSHGSGIQYQPGDYTGGETVDWNTGVGNGGVSVCGSTAIVEYICIDYWDGARWVQWSCGYATTC